MKVIVASFQCESNSKANLHPQKSDFEYFAGEDIFKKLVVKNIFEDAGFEIVPSIYANAFFPVKSMVSGTFWHKFFR